MYRLWELLATGDCLSAHHLLYLKAVLTPFSFAQDYASLITARVPAAPGFEAKILAAAFDSGRLTPVPSLLAYSQASDPLMALFVPNFVENFYNLLFGQVHSPSFSQRLVGS